MHYELDEEFKMRVKHNFKLYVLLTSKSRNWKEDDILGSIYGLKGYKCHKIIKYQMNSSHIHIKFDEEYMAREAVDHLKNLGSDLSAVLVDDMLRDWFNYEIRSGHSPHWTLTIVDIIGSPPLDLNFLTENILNSIFRDFGSPYMLPYTAALNEPHVQVLFGSMTEALAACMAFGEWHDCDQKIDSFFYRIRINPSDKEAKLIRNSGGTPKEAFKLDYFVNVRHEMIQKENLESDDTEKIPRNKGYQNKGIQKIRKQKADSEVNNAATRAHRTPILCVPVIAPLSSYAEALMSSGKQLNIDFANAILNFQQTCSVSTRTVPKADSKAILHPSIGDKKEDQHSSCNDVEKLESLRSKSEQVTLNNVSISAPPKPDLVARKQVNTVTTRQKANIYSKGQPRVFERRK